MYLFSVIACLLSFSLYAAEVRKEIPQTLKDALFQAISAKNFAAVQALYAKHSPEELQAVKGVMSLQTPLMWAVEAHAPEIVAFLLQQGADLEARDINRRTPLMLAVNEIDIPITKMLLDAGAEVNAQDINGRTALMRTGVINSPELAKLLVSAGANVDIQSKDKKTVLNYVDSQEREVFKKVIKEGLQKHAIQNALWLAIKDNTPDRFELLLEAIAEPDLENRKAGRTLLMYAVQKHRDKMVDLLLKRKIDVSAQDNKGFSALMIAAVEGKPLLVEKLIRAGAAINQKNFAGNSALSLVIEDANNENFLIDTGILHALIALGAEVNTRDNDDITPFMAAVIKNFPRVVKELVAAGADPRAVDADGNRVLEHYPRLKQQRQKMQQAIAEGEKEYKRRQAEKSSTPKNSTEEKMEEEKRSCSA